MTMIRRSKSPGCPVAAAEPLEVPQRLAILARLLSAAAARNPPTAASGELIRSPCDPARPPHAAAPNNKPTRRSWVTGISRWRKLVTEINRRGSPEQ